MIPFRFIDRAVLSALLACAAPALAQPATTEAYRAQAQAELDRLKAEPPAAGGARNVILFIGDGMGVSTLTAARIHQGQRQGGDGESYMPAMDSLSHTALVKTYSHNGQVADSASTATAILSGVKTRNGMLGVGPEDEASDCAASRRHALPSLFGLAQSMGLATGIVSTARVTHATPAAAYAHTPRREWESDSLMPEAARSRGCADIALQMIEGDVGSRLDLVLGGGRAHFLPTSSADPEYPRLKGLRADERDLIAEWRRRNPGGVYVWNRAEFESVDLARASRLLGLFEPEHMRYEADRADDAGGEPSLAEMTRAATAMLDGRGTGYVLLVEGGRIDHAHHEGNARRALEDTIALDDAVRVALEMTDRGDTLILVTSDHSHVLTIAGYPRRGNPILGLAGAGNTPSRARDGKAYTTLGYANGPGAAAGDPRGDPAGDDTQALDYRQQALVPLEGETHGGEDVAARATGPMAHLVRGTIEQHTLFYVMREALTAGIGE